MNCQIFTRYALRAAVATAAVWSAASPLVLASTATGPQFGQGPSLGALAGPLIIVVLLAAAAFWVRRLTNRRIVGVAKGRIDVVAARQVAPHRSVQVIRVGGKNYLIGVGENIELLSELPDGPLEAEPQKNASGSLEFLQLLKDYSTKLAQRRRTPSQEEEKP